MHPVSSEHKSWLGPSPTNCAATGLIGLQADQVVSHSLNGSDVQTLAPADGAVGTPQGLQTVEFLQVERTAVGPTRHLGCAALVILARHLPADNLLMGDPRIDVWNMLGATGSWRRVLETVNCLQTDLVGGPDGGVLYFIDTPGALLALPLTWAFGPTLSYNLVLLGRMAMAGLAAQMLCEALSKPGIHSWLAGAAYATTPFVLCELGNGISEVCATQWLPLTLWAAIRVIDRGQWKDWALLGLLQGITSITTFYYGLTSALLVAPLVGFHLIRRFISDSQQGIQTLKGGALAGLCGAMLVLPHWLIFRASLADPGALIKRDGELNVQLMAHNAVDPRVYFTPGDFQSVDLAAVYGEPFITQPICGGLSLHLSSSPWFWAAVVFEAGHYWPSFH